jgi:hypothetical protein
MLDKAQNIMGVSMMFYFFIPKQVTLFGTLSLSRMTKRILSLIIRISSQGQVEDMAFGI